MRTESVCDERHIPEMAVRDRRDVCIKDETDVAVHFWMNSTEEAKLVGRLIASRCRRLVWIAVGGCLTILKPV